MTYAGRVLLALCMPVLVAGCTTAYYKTLEQFGVEKRQILTDRVEDARNAQIAAKGQFADALEQYRSLVSFDAGELEDVYDEMSAAFERSERRAETVNRRIEDIGVVAEDLFEEWADEIDEYTDPKLRRQSEALLRETRNDYGEMMVAMNRAASSMQPVLALFRDQVLFLRHNLNAQAIGALGAELENIELVTAEAIDKMAQSIAEAERFLESMR